jgi:transposase
MTMRGCGRILALTLITDLTELGQRDRRQAAALAGLAPIARDNGSKESQRVTPCGAAGTPQPRREGGRGQLRKVAHMATVSASRAHDNPFEACHLALIARGKPEKRAIVAVLHAMIVTLDAMVRCRGARSTAPDHQRSLRCKTVAGKPRTGGITTSCRDSFRQPPSLPPDERTRAPQNRRTTLTMLDGEASIGS